MEECKVSSDKKVKRININKIRKRANSVKTTAERIEERMLSECTFKPTLSEYSRILSKKNKVKEKHSLYNDAERRKNKNLLIEYAVYYYTNIIDCKRDKEKFLKTKGK